MLKEMSSCVINKVIEADSGNWVESHSKNSSLILGCGKNSIGSREPHEPAKSSTHGQSNFPT